MIGMPFYGTVQAVKDNLPKLAKYIKPDDQATALTDIKQTTVEGALEEVTRMIDAALASKYAVPFSDPPELIDTIASDLASYRLARRFLTSISQEENQNILAMRKDAKELLANLASGSASIPGVEAADDPDELADLFDDETTVFDMGDPSGWQNKIS